MNGVSDPTDPPRPSLPGRQDLQPCDVTEEQFDRFVNWLESTDRGEVDEITWDFAGAETEALLAIIHLWLYPERHFDEPWWMDLEERHGGPMWVDDFEINSTVLSSDMEVWARVVRIEELLKDAFGYEITDVRAAGHVLNVVTRGMAKLRQEAGAGDVDPDWWLRVDWPTILEWWDGAIKRRAGRFEPDGHVYLLGGGGFYKIGKAKRPDRRIGQLAIQLTWRVSVEHVIECEDYSVAERELHRHFTDKRRNGEWFALEEDDVVWIKSIARMCGERVEHAE